MFRFATVLALITTAAALKSDSKAGKALLSKSSRSLEDEDQYGWMLDYSMVFQSCHKVVNFVDGENQEDGQEAVQYRHLVKYKLCPSNKCKYGCKGAEYVTDMYEFVDAWTEWTMNDQEKRCEDARETCENTCDGYYGDEDVCYNGCYKDMGLTECIEEDKDDDGYEFELQEWLECKESEAVDEYGNKLFVGPKCSENGEQINLGVFRDEYCTEDYSSEIFATYYRGTVLPYQDENLVAENCISCAEEGDNYYLELTEICEEMYPTSGKCETNLATSIPYPTTSGCNFINHLNLYEEGYEPVNQHAAVAFAVIFGMSTIGLAALAAYLFKANSRNIDLQSGGAIV